MRAKIQGTDRIPRLCVFRSNKHIYAQIIDDEKGKTLAAASDLGIKTAKSKEPRVKNKKEDEKEKIEEAKKSLSGKIAVGYKIGQQIAQKATEKKIKKIVFDRGGYKYHGRVRALAEGARDSGLQF